MATGSRLWLGKMHVVLFRMVDEGKSPTEIDAAMLELHGARAKTVDVWMTSAIRSMEAKTLPEAVARAKELGLLG